MPTSKRSHPGLELCAQLKALEISQCALATNCKISQSTLTDICKGRRRITVNMSVKIGKSLNQAPDNWALKQLAYHFRQSGRKYRHLKPIVEG